jgi:hypothetical protein
MPIATTLRTEDYIVSVPVNAETFSWLTFGASGIRVNLLTGEVQIPEHLSLSTASLAFWLELSRYYPMFTPPPETPAETRGFGT